MKPIPKHLLNDNNKRVLEYITPLSCHGDIVQYIEKAYSNNPSVTAFCPDGKNFRYCFWYKEDTIIAFAVGMQNVYLYLPDDAKISGARNFSTVGDGWFEFPYDHEELGYWVNEQC